MADCCLNVETQMCAPCRRTYACRRCWPALKWVRKLDLCTECKAKEEAKKSAKRSTFEEVEAAIKLVAEKEDTSHECFIAEYNEVLKEHGWDDLDYIAEHCKRYGGITLSKEQE